MFLVVLDIHALHLFSVTVLSDLYYLKWS